MVLITCLAAEELSQSLNLSAFDTAAYLAEWDYKRHLKRMWELHLNVILAF